MRPNTVKFNEKDIRYYRALKKLTKFLSRHIFLIVLTLAVWSFGYFAFSSWHGNYGDGDGYMRALKIKHWLQSPSFWEQPIYESNYPFGEITHWTRPLDIIWIIISLPFWFLNLPLKETLFLSGAFLSPIIGIVAVLVLVYGLKRRFNIYLTLLGCLIFLCQPSTQAIMAPSRPDHHSLLLLLTTYSFSLVLCWLKKRQDRYLRLLGVTLALATFTVVEGIIIYVLFLSFFLYLFIFKNISLQSAVKISKYFALSVTVFWFLNPPYEGWFYLDTGRLSILYVVASWLTLIGFKILDLSHLHIARLKILSLISMGLGFALAFLVIFGPDVFHSPFSKNIQEIFVGRISEMRSITDLKFSGMLANYTFPLIALILNLILLRNRSYHRLLILNLCLGIPLFIASCLHIRFLHYSI
ncbi:MAG: hypothetical protein J6W96_05640, partial [Alphaproteobacteria bacterium]|nr:hypothetical protein [Alphaproteobacteria bacterium]